MIGTRVSSLLLAVLLLGSTACGWRSEQRPIGYAYTGPSRLNLREDLGLRAETSATVGHGERLEILEARRRFVRVRTASGAEGWADSAYLLTQTQMDDLNKLAQRAGEIPSQGEGTVFDTLNVHVNANRNAASFTQFEEGDAFSVVAHTTTEREAMADGVRRLDDWFLVRTAEGRAGWVLTRMVRMGIPDEIAQYASGAFIMAYRKFGEVRDPATGEMKGNWLWATSSGLRHEYDFDSVRLFTYNPRQRRYETSFVDRKLRGFYPLEAWTGTDSPDGFSFVTEEEDGSHVRRVYVRNGARMKLAEKHPFTLPPPLPQVGEAESFDKEDSGAAKSFPERAVAYARWWLGL